ncbi:MAG: segregation/condensation protein A [Deltaproteobacteria bacterium]|nr:segregation/condensation protein A [Deltaproteobacteria bacterium]
MTNYLELNQDLDVHIEELFSGPFDLLLHLVRKHELELPEIPVGFITEKYLEALRKLQQLNVELASDFLVIAATLVELKSRFLVSGTEEPEDEEELSDPVSVLMKRLEQYRRFRQISFWLRDKLTVNRIVWRREVPLELEGRDLEGVETDTLKSVFEDLLPAVRKMGFSTKNVIRRISLRDRISEVIEFMAVSGKVSFFQLMRMHPDPVTSFLAVLEIAKTGLLSIVESEDDYYLIFREDKGSLFDGIE